MSDPCPKNPSIDHDAIRQGEQGAKHGGFWEMEDEQLELFHCPACRSTLCRSVPMKEAA